MDLGVTGRSCKISEVVNTTIEAIVDFLSDIFNFTFNGTIILEEMCMTGN